ncbi:MAG: Na+/H+ antiporter subunit E [Thermomicrobiales bacterium]|nr:Na+/H+ antiporter subunit E [Thermomicrobiales bacterium]
MILLLGIWAASTAIFCMLFGTFSWQYIVVGGVISAGIMWIFKHQITPKPVPDTGLSMHLIVYAPVLIWYLFIDILRGTWQVIMTTLGVRPLRHPGIIKIPLEAHSPYGVGPVGYFITLSPGSFLVDVDWENQVMLVHVLDASDPEAIRRDAEKYYRLWEYGRYQPRLVDERLAEVVEETKHE